MNTQYKSKICITSLLLLNIIQVNVQKLYGAFFQWKSFPKIPTDNHKVNEVKACPTPDQAARFSQLIENLVQNLRTYCIPWECLESSRERYNNQIKRRDELSQKLALESITDEEKNKTMELLTLIQKTIDTTAERIREHEKQIEKCLTELGNPSTPWESLQEAFNNFKLENVDSIKLEKITLSTDDENITCYVYSPQSIATRLPIPAFFGYMAVASEFDIIAAIPIPINSIFLSMIS